MTHIRGRGLNGSGTDRFKCTAGWDPWGDWSTCNVTCGTGSRTRSRTCNSESTDDCIGADSEVSNCNVGACSGKKIYLKLL